jgi:hypothetical protein
MPVVYLEPNQEETLNRHDFWRGCYATMLAEIKLEHIKEFFSGVPMVKGGRRIEGVEFFNLLWNEKGLIPMDWNYGAIHPLEPFLIERGYDAMGFFRKMLHRNNRATYMPGKVLLSWFYPVMDKFFDQYDLRELVLNMIMVYTEKYVEGTLHKRIKKTSDGDWMYSYMMFIGHRSFKKYYIFNFDFIVGEQIRAFPKMLDLPEFEELSYLIGGEVPRPSHPKERARPFHRRLGESDRVDRGLRPGFSRFPRLSVPPSPKRRFPSPS